MKHLTLLIPDLLCIGVLVYLLIEAIFAGRRDSRSTFGELAAGTIVLAVALALNAHQTGQAFGGMLLVDGFALYFKWFFTAVFFTTVFLCRDFFRDTLRQREFGLILWSTLIGLYFLASANHLLVFFIALEILTMALYILTAYSRHIMASHKERYSASIEAALKYLILGSAASGFTIFGIALVYLKTGSLSFAGISAAREILLGSKLGVLGLLFIFAGLGFKIAVFPFQFWVPDVYQGAPTPVTALMAVASKAAGFLLVIRLFVMTLAPLGALWHQMWALLAWVTLLFGNLGALKQSSLKRLMGYSSVSHAGYLMIALASGSAAGTASVLFYLIGYAAATLAVFHTIILVEKKTGNDAEGFDGLAQSSPFLASVFLIALLSLAGIPPLAGFMGKFWILFTGLQAGLKCLVVLALAMVVAGVYYYLHVAIRMYFRAPRCDNAIVVPFSSKLILVTLTMLTLTVGIFQGPILRLISSVLPAQ